MVAEVVDVLNRPFAPPSATEPPIAILGTHERLDCGLEVVRTPIRLQFRPGDQFTDVKDPHTFERGGNKWMVATTDRLSQRVSMSVFRFDSTNQSWQSQGVVQTPDYYPGDRFCASGIMSTEHGTHAFAQTDCFLKRADQDKGAIEHFLVSPKNPAVWRYSGTAVRAKDIDCAAIYDSDPFSFPAPNHQTTYGLVFTGYKDFVKKGLGDNAYKPVGGNVYVATSHNLFESKWQIDPLEIHFTKAKGDEWIDEGMGIHYIDDFGRLPFFLLNGVYFAPNETGNTQRAFLAASRSIKEPFQYITHLDPTDHKFGETGHGSIALEGQNIVFYHQERFTRQDDRWHLAQATFNRDALCDLIQAQLAVTRKIN